MEDVLGAYPPPPMSSPPRDGPSPTPGSQAWAPEPVILASLWASLFVNLLLCYTPSCLPRPRSGRGPLSAEDGSGDSWPGPEELLSRYLGSCPCFHRLRACSVQVFAPPHPPSQSSSFTRASTSPPLLCHLTSGLVQSAFQHAGLPTPVYSRKHGNCPQLTEENTEAQRDAGCASSHATGMSSGWGWSPGLQTPCSPGVPGWGTRCLRDGSMSPSRSDPPLPAVYTALTRIATLGPLCG